MSESESEKLSADLKKPDKTVYIYCMISHTEILEKIELTNSDRKQISGFPELGVREGN